MDNGWDKIFSPLILRLCDREGKMANFNLRKFFHITNGILLILINWMIFAHSNRLPEIIPIHFNIDGTPDNWSGKKSFLNEIIIVVWALNAFLYIIMFFIQICGFMGN